MNEPVIRALIAKWREKATDLRQQASDLRRRNYLLCEGRADTELERAAATRDAVASAIESRANELEALLAAGEAAETPFDFRAHLHRQRVFSERTFGPGTRTAGVIDHIRKELLEIEAEPNDLREWIDVVILALDGAWRAGFDPDEIIDTLVTKQARNEARQWPDWRTQPTDRAIEHVKAASLSPAVPTQEIPLNHGDVRDWKTAALIFGESLGSVGPTGYYAFTPQQWLDWARATATPAPAPHPAPSQNATSATPAAQSAARADDRAGTNAKDVR